MVPVKYAEEQHARDLHRELSREFSQTAPGTQVSVEGGGVHWHCAAARGELSCEVNCFDSRGPEYLAAFKCGDCTGAWGRTRSRADVVAAVSRWLDGYGVEDLYTGFDFVDQQKRALATIEAEAVHHCPELGHSVERELRHDMCDLHKLWFTAGDRSCRVSYYGENEFPDAFFHWDGCQLFQIQTGDPARLAAVLKRWLCDRAMPSEMAAEFPWIEVGQLARYYEEGRPMEGEFITSWDSVEDFYRRMDFPFAGQVLAMIARIRQAGYDKRLRAGQSLWSLVVSRSRRHGLREDQPSIAFVFRTGGMDAYASIDGEEKHSVPEIEFTPEVRALLDRLAAKDID